MTTPFPPPAENDTLERRLKQGGRVSLDVIQTFTAPTTALTAPKPLVIGFPGAEGLAKRLTADPGIKVRANLAFTYSEIPNFAILAFLNMPKADADTPATVPGFLGSIAFFGHAHGTEPDIFQLLATPVVKRLDGPVALTLTLAPTALPARAIQTQKLAVTASLDLVLSRVEKPQ